MSEARVSRRVALVSGGAGGIGLAVNCVAPGVIDAPMLHTLRLPGDGTPVAAGVPAGRLGTADEAAAYVTGTTLDVNGGLLMR